MIEEQPGSYTNSFRPASQSVDDDELASLMDEDEPHVDSDDIYGQEIGDSLNEDIQDDALPYRDPSICVICNEEAISEKDSHRLRR